MSCVTTSQLEVGKTITTDDHLTLKVVHKHVNDLGIEVVELCHADTNAYYTKLSDYGLKAVGARMVDVDEAEHD